MIKAILVDDERPALRELEFLLKNYPKISVDGMYKDPFEAIENIGLTKPDVVFLDINMPKLKGTDAASMILDVSPDTDIVFVTAFDEYAIEAFELHALDYILKPVQVNRFERTIDLIIKKKTHIQKYSNRKLRIKCLGGFYIAWENEEPIKWRTEKTRELFAFLLQNQGREIAKDELLDKLWTEDDPEKAIRQLYNGIYHIRKALEQYGVDGRFISINSNYNLKLNSVYYDVQCFYELGKGNFADNLDTLEEMEAIYVGDYLQGDDYSWACVERESLEKMYQQCLIKLSEKYIEKKLFNKAEIILEKVHLKNPYEEIIMELLLRLYLETGEKSKAVRHFNDYSRLLETELSIKPNDKLYALYESIK